MPSAADTAREFRAAVNMTAAELRRWLATPESRDVGITHPGETDHQSGARIVELLGRNAEGLTEDDLAHMRKVVGYVKRHCAQGPQGDAEHSRWRYSLMNWGHDPLKG